jgi:hypothetical protein
MAIITRLERKSRRWEEVWNGDSEPVASIVAGRLEADGIRARIHASLSPYGVAAMSLGGSWTILVPAGKAERARDVLRENDEGRNLVESDDGGSLTENQRSTIRFALLFGLGIVLVLLVAAVKGA